MPLLLPDLDDRRWSDLVDEGRALIPRYAPVWTDFNVHDPGVMLIELYAWLTEASIYQLNQVPDRHFWKFLSLIGYRPRGPRPARIQIAFGPLAPASGFDLSAGVEFDSAGPSGAVPFCTVRDIHLAPVTLAALQVDDGGGAIVSHTRDLHDGLPIEAFGAAPQPGAALYLGFSVAPSAVPVALWFWLAGPGDSAGERRRIEAEANRQREACRPARSDVICPGEAPTPRAPVWSPPAHHSARIVWEAFAGGTWTPLAPVSMPARPAAGQVADDTRSLTLDGLVEVNLPAAISQTVIGGESAALFYLRARLVAGAWDAPVVIDDLEPNVVEARKQQPLVGAYAIAAGVVVTGAPPAIDSQAYLQFTLVDGALASLTFVGASATGMPGFTLLAYTPPSASTAGSITLAGVILGNGSGAPRQALTLPAAPVVDDLKLYVHDGVTWTRWERREDFDAAQRASRVFTLDPVGGVVACGDGQHGEAFPYGVALVASGHSTWGAAGGVAASGAMTLGSGPRNAALLAGLTAADIAQLRAIARNPHPAAGGADEETLAATVAEPAAVVHAHERLQDLAASYDQDTLDQNSARRGARHRRADAGREHARHRTAGARSSRNAGRAGSGLGQHQHAISLPRCGGGRHRRDHSLRPGTATAAELRTYRGGSQLSRSAPHDLHASRGRRPQLRLDRGRGAGDDHPRRRRERRSIGGPRCARRVPRSAHRRPGGARLAIRTQRLSRRDLAENHHGAGCRLRHGSEVDSRQQRAAVRGHPDLSDLASLLGRACHRGFVMSTPLPGLEIPLERITWRDGQLLASRDLRDEIRGDDRFRHLHVRYLHRSWGIVTGFEVTALGPQTLRVAPGFALDIEGRELLLAEAANVSAPILPRTFLVLVTRFAPVTTLRRPPELDALCLDGGSPLRAGRPEFLWRTVDDVQIGLDILLVGVWAENGNLDEQLHPEIRRFARGEAQPRCYAAETFGGQTNWIQKADLRAANVIWLQARVDTSEAGFVHPPFYFARLSSPSASAFPSGPPALFILDYSASDFTACVLSRRDLARVTISTNDAVRTHAYELWERAGKPEGRSEEFWFAAIAELEGKPVSFSALSAQQVEAAQWTISWLAVEAPRLDFIAIKETTP